MKKQKSDLKNYILLPAQQLQTDGNSNPSLQNFFLKLNSNRKTVKVKKSNSNKKMNLKVLDSIHENGAKLVTMDSKELAEFHFSQPGCRIVPEVFYEKALAPKMEINKLFSKSGNQNLKITIKIVSENNNPLKGCTVVAFTNFKKRHGDNGITNSKGEVSLQVISKKIDRIYVYPEHSYWPKMLKSVVISGNSISINLNDIDLSYTDGLRHFYKSLSPVNVNITVGIIDTGVGPHSDIKVSGGANLITGENENDFKDNGEGHGTHVAGIVGANGTIKGAAAGVKINSYRVFPKGEDASNFFIMKAIDRAVSDGCDLINMSLGYQGSLDEGLMSSIKDAYSKGVLCFVSTGNDSRRPVGFPASYSLSIAVSAMGRKGTFPPDTEPNGSIAKPYGKDIKNFIAEFSNIGDNVDLTAPGVGIISTFPGNKYAVMSGTSMSCPAAVGMAARLIASQPNLLKMAKRQERSDEIMKFLSSRTKSMGFENIYEGNGMLF